MTETHAPSASPDTQPLRGMTEEAIRARIDAVIRSTQPDHWLDYGPSAPPSLTAKGLTLQRAQWGIVEVAGSLKRTHEDFANTRTYHTELDMHLPGESAKSYQGSASPDEIHLPGAVQIKLGKARQLADTRARNAGTRDLLFIPAITWSDLERNGIKRASVPKKSRRGGDDDDGPRDSASSGGAPPPDGLGRGQDESAKDHVWRVFNSYRDAKQWKQWDEIQAAAGIPTGRDNGKKVKEFTDDEFDRASAQIDKKVGPPKTPSNGGAPGPNGTSTSGPPPSGPPMTAEQKAVLSRLADTLKVPDETRRQLLRDMGWAGGPVPAGVADKAIATLREECEANGINPDTGEITQPADTPF